MKRFFLILVFYLVYFTNGQANVYQIEMLIFARFTSQYLDEEQWPSIDLSNFNYSIGQSIHSVHSSKFALNREQADLSKNSAYQILLHVAWIQCITNGRLAQSAKRIKGKDMQGTIHISAQRYFDVFCICYLKKRALAISAFHKIFVCEAMK